MAEVTIAGRKVVLRERFKLREQFGVVAGWGKMFPVGRLPYQEQIAPMMPVVESWEFPGDPQSIEAWADLDGIAEFLPLWHAIGMHLDKLYSGQQQQAKNSDAPSTSPNG